MRRFIFISLFAILLSEAAYATLTAIPAGNLLPNNTTLTFNAGPVGAITSSNAMFTSAGFTNISLTGAFPVTSGTDILGPGVGAALMTSNALAPTPNGVLSIIPVSGTMQNTPIGSGYVFQTAGTITQFGFTGLDQAIQGILVQTFLNGAAVDTLAATFITSGSRLFFESSQPIDEFRIISTSDKTNLVGMGLTGPSGWALDDIVIARESATATAVPTLGNVAKLLLILLLMGLSYVLLPRIEDNN